MKSSRMFPTGSKRFDVATLWRALAKLNLCSRHSPFSVNENFYLEAQVGLQATNCFRLRIQPMDATDWLNLSAGVS